MRSFVRGIFACAVLLLANAAAFATQPPSAAEAKRMHQILALKGPLTAEQAAERADIKHRLANARARGNHRIDPVLLDHAITKVANDYAIQHAKPGENPLIAATPPLNWRGMPSVGNVKIFALLIDFSDYPSGNTKDAVHSKLFGAGTGIGFPRESLANYYERASYDQLDLSGGSTLGWYRPSSTRANIAQTRTGREALIKEAIESFDTAGHDFSQYDNNNDGKIDYFIVIWTGPDNGWSNFWWGYQTSYGNSSFTVDGVRLGKYSWQWESNPVGGTFNPRVVIHETGHALGLPDYYDYDGDVGPDGGVGGLDMMDGNWGDHNCFSKWVLNWLTPSVVASGTQSVTLRPSATSKDCVVVWPGLAGDTPFSEMFVIQNRYRTSNDTGWPTNGILAWHVDATLNAGGNNYAYDNSYTDHKLIRLMEADGLESLESGGRGDAGDFYTIGQMLDPYSSPNTLRYSGVTSGVGLRNIPAASDSMTITVEVGAQDTLKITPTTGFTASKQPGQGVNPSTMDFVLENTGTSPINWSAAIDMNWVDLSATSGTLAANTSATVTATINASANALAAGVHTGEFVFSNTTLNLGGFKRPLSFTMVIPPDNDNFADASVITGRTGNASIRNEFASEEVGEPKHGNVTNGGKSVWWKWVPNQSGEVTFDTTGSNFDTTLSVYGGRSLDALTQIVGNDDDGSNRSSKVTFTAQAFMPHFIAVDGYNKRIGDITLNWDQSTSAPALLSSILPSVRSGIIGAPLTAFASLINNTDVLATNCSIAKPARENAGFGYQTTSAANVLTGTADTKVDITAHGTQNFLFEYTPDRAMDGVQIGLVFDCDNTVPASSVPGLNRFVVSADAAAVADVISVVATVSNDGIANVPTDNGVGFFSASAINIGPGGTFDIYADDAGTGLSLYTRICKTDDQGVCAAPATDKLSLSIAKDETVLLAVFIYGQGNIALDAANHRLFLRFDQSETPRGGTSVAVRTFSE